MRRGYALKYQQVARWFVARHALEAAKPFEVLYLALLEETRTMLTNDKVIFVRYITEELSRFYHYRPL